MSDLVVDSSVVAKWILPEADSAKAQQLIVQTAVSGERLIVLDCVCPEVAFSPKWPTLSGSGIASS